MNFLNSLRLIYYYQFVYEAQVLLLAMPPFWFKPIPASSQLYSLGMLFEPQHKTQKYDRLEI